ncbi:hypothetical protein QUA80_09020 [Microcoleus sp. F4-D5]
MGSLDTALLKETLPAAGSVKQEWEKAVGALCLFLAVAARENQPSAA